MAYSDNEVFDIISEQLTIREQIIRTHRKNNGHTGSEIPVPTLTLSFDEIRELTDRTKIRRSLIEKFIFELGRRGLEVVREDESLVIVKPLAEVETVFDSLDELRRDNREVAAAEGL